MTGRFEDLSLSAKLMSILVFVAAVAVVVASVSFVVIDRVSYKTGLGRRLSAEAQIVGSNSTAAILFNDPAAARATLAALEAEPHVVGAGIYDRNGRLFASYGKRELPVAVGELGFRDDAAESVRFEPGHVVLFRRIVSDRETIGFVALDSNLTELSDRLIWLSMIVIAVVCGTLLLAAILSVRLQRLISRPILDLVGVARRVSTERDYSVRAPPGGRDETGLLVLAFNEMLARIQERERSLTSEISERKKAEIELADARDAAVEARKREEMARKAAEQASALKSAFLANMSHEIRTPLNVILGYNSLIESALEESGDESQKPLVEGVARASKRLMTTVHGILDISRIESGAFDVHPVPIQLAPFIDRLVADYRVLAKGKGLALDLHNADQRTTLLFDEYCLSHALTNLLDNAVKFTETGGITVSVAEEPDGSIRIEVRDTGIGIDAEYLKHIAEPFSQEQLGSTRKFEGSGLGLALTKRFLQTHEASLSVNSRKGEGASFFVNIPANCVLESSGGAAVERGATEPGVSAAPRGPINGDPGEYAKPCVLVVEDDAETQDLMRLMLHDRYRVVTASTAPEARRQLAFPGQNVRLILMDLALRGDEDGLMLTRALRGDERWRGLPIIAVTAHALAEDRDNALKAGCDAYLPKPVERERLLSVVHGFTR